MASIKDVNTAIFDIVLLAFVEIKRYNPELAANIESQLKEIISSDNIEKTEAFSVLAEKAQQALSGSPDLFFQSLTALNRAPLNPERLRAHLSVIKGGLHNQPSNTSKES